MPLPRTNTLQDHDWVAVANLGDSDTIVSRNIPCPFSGWVERIYLSSQTSPTTDITVTVSVEGGATLATIVMPGATAAGESYLTEWTEPGSPVRFSNGEAINLVTDGLGTSPEELFATIVMRRQ